MLIFTRLFSLHIRCILCRHISLIQALSQPAAVGAALMYVLWPWTRGELIL